MVNAISMGNTSPAGFTTGQTGAMGKDQFLELLMSQLKYQDPLEPMGGTEFAAQLAQFSSLEQLTNLNDSMSQSIDANFLLIQSVNNTMTANLIGKDAKIDGADLSYIGQDSIEFGYDLPANANKVSVNIYDENNNLIKTFDNPGTVDGEHKLEWDFRNNNGDLVNQGNYRIEVTATSNDGNEMLVGIFKYGMIGGIKFGENGTRIMVGGIEYDLGQIMEINNPTNQQGDGA